jgi:hypothetical protein
MSGYPSIGRVEIMAASAPEFYFDGMAVGYFVGSDGPRTSGSHRYEPHRGPGHYEMQTLLRVGGLPRYSYVDEGKRVEFTVKGCPEYGILDLCDFECDPQEPS